MADGGFRGEDAIVIPFRRKEADSAQKKVFNKRLSSIRWKLEKLFSRLKVFCVLKQSFRHDISKHRLIFLTLIALYSMDVVKHPLKKR